MAASIFDMNQRIVSLRILITNARTDGEKITLKENVRKLQSRIANRKRYAAMRSLGLVKTPYGWE
jgi:hypothetical protein